MAEKGQHRQNSARTGPIYRLVATLYVIDLLIWTIAFWQLSELT